MDNRELVQRPIYTSGGHSIGPCSFFICQPGASSGGHSFEFLIFSPQRQSRYSRFLFQICKSTKDGREHRGALLTGGDDLTTGQALREGENDKR